MGTDVYLEECITPSGGRHKISTQHVSQDPKEIERYWKKIKEISRDILIAEYERTGVMSGEIICEKERGENRGEIFT